MKNGSQFMKGFFTLLYLLGIFYLTLNNASFAQMLKIPLYVIPALSALSIVLIGYRLISLYLSVGKLEREFTLIVNHVFRTPITSIMWFTKELEKDLPQQEKLLYLQSMENITNKILSIVDIFAGIKDINDISGYFFEATSLREIVEKSITKFREEINKKNITFQVPTFKDIPLLTVDLKKISFVVDTLIENAVFYTPKNGKVLIECIAEKEKISLYVSDTGIGLSMIDKMRIFSRFYRSKRAKSLYTDGMGLRLYLSKQIIKRHKGNMYAKSIGENKGTTLIVELPIKR
jgi:signal transduction histidine kinase